ncbi:MAG: hypothetical protein JKY31_11540 [Rhodobacteraceae bacterium]|nr:hypothetical protein [Paracoccaceae bacterium]
MNVVMKAFSVLGLLALLGCAHDGEFPDRDLDYIEFRKDLGYISHPFQGITEWRIYSDDRYYSLAFASFRDGTKVLRRGHIDGLYGEAREILNYEQIQLFLQVISDRYAVCHPPNPEPNTVYCAEGNADQTRLSLAARVNGQQLWISQNDAEIRNDTGQIEEIYLRLRDLVQ